MGARHQNDVRTRPPNGLRFSCEALRRPPPTIKEKGVRRRPKRLGPRLLQARVRPTSSQAAGFILPTTSPITAPPTPP